MRKPQVLPPVEDSGKHIKMLELFALRLALHEQFMTIHTGGISSSDRTTRDYGPQQQPGQYQVSMAASGGGRPVDMGTSQKNKSQKPKE